MKAAREENQRVLGIGCRNTLELRLLTGVLSELRREDARGFVPSLRVVPHDGLENLLYDAEIQIMPTFKEGAPKRAVYREMSKCSVVCAVSPDSELVGRKQVSVVDISQSGRIAISRPEAAPRAALAVQNQLIADMNPNDIIFCESVEILSYVVASGFASAVLVDTPGIRVSGVEYIPVGGTETVSYGAAYMAEEMTELLRRFLEIFASMSK